METIEFMKSIKKEFEMRWICDNFCCQFAYNLTAVGQRKRMFDLDKSQHNNAEYFY